MRRRYLVLLALLGFVATLVLHAPAGVVYAWSAAQAGTTRLHGVHGTLAQGGFAALTVDNRPVLTDARWRLHPWWLPLLRLSADLEAGGESVVRARVSRGLLGALRLSDLSAAGSVKALMGVLGQPALPIEGQARLDLPVLRIADGVPIEAQGTAEIQNLVWTLAREPLALGGFAATLGTDDKGIQVTIDGGPGPVELDGSATLAIDRAYEVHLQLRPRPDATPQVQSLVRSLGQPDAQGWYHLRRHGTL